VFAFSPTGGTKAQLPHRSRIPMLMPSSRSRDTSVPQKRTTHRSRAGRKLYAVRDAKGRFTDIQLYERASRQDQRRRSKAEISAKKR